MTSLMSIFDPSMSVLPHSGWVIVLLSAVLSKNEFWKNPSLLQTLTKTLFKDLSELFKSQSVLFVSLFLFIMWTNMMGVLPFTFCATSHLSFNFTLALFLWLGMTLWYVMTSPKQLLSSLTPTGSPLVLAPILVLIELISMLIRPLTLSLRLMANMMAGHMILALLSKGVLFMLGGSSLFVVLAFFITFEIGVAMIQAYVFASLMSLYWEESESSH